MLQSNSAFIPRLAAEAYNLRQLTKKHCKFKWTDIHQKEFEKLKELFHEKMLNQPYDPTKETFIFVDAHHSGLDAILAQGNSAEDNVPVATASRAASKVEHRYWQLDLERMAVDFGLRRFRQYIVGGTTVTVVTDHNLLTSIFRNTRLGINSIGPN